MNENEKLKCDECCKPLRAGDPIRHGKDSGKAVCMQPYCSDQTFTDVAEGIVDKEGKILWFDLQQVA